MAKAIRQHRDEAFADHQMHLAEKHQTRIVTYHDEEYPFRLREIYDPPPVLYMAGERQPEDERAVAIVGTRITSSYGRRMAKMFSEGLCAYGITIVSGLARGVDTVAHQTVLDNQGWAIAVLGSGLDSPYPYENRGMMRVISENGVVMTEQPFETGPDAVNFPQRNRIISGLSLGTIVIEAGHSSGALITAR
jgi:DNA processing protein